MGLKTQCTGIHGGFRDVAYNGYMEECEIGEETRHVSAMKLDPCMENATKNIVD